MTNRRPAVQQRRRPGLRHHLARLRAPDLRAARPAPDQHHLLPRGRLHHRVAGRPRGAAARQGPGTGRGLVRRDRQLQDRHLVHLHRPGALRRCLHWMTSMIVYCTPGTLADFIASELFGTKPKAAVPFAMPVRLTDNNACKGVQKFDTNGELIDPYCYADFDGNGTADLCAATVDWTNPGGTTLDVCVTEDGRTLTGRTASTRVRWAMKSYTRTPTAPGQRLGGAWARKR